MKIEANDIKIGNVIEHNKKFWQILKTAHTQPGKGGAYIQVEMKEIPSGIKSNHRFRSSETVEKIRLDQKEYQYLYMEGNNIALMDKKTYEQIFIEKKFLENQLNFLREGMDVFVESYDNAPLTASLSETITMTVKECEPIVKGQTAASSYKSAILENGLRIMVPPFINTGDKITVNTKTQEYVERIK